MPPPSGAIDARNGNLSLPVRSEITPNAAGDTTAARPATVLMMPLAKLASLGATSIGPAHIGLRRLQKEQGRTECERGARLVVHKQHRGKTQERAAEAEDHGVAPGLHHVAASVTSPPTVSPIMPAKNTAEEISAMLRR
jgi:hypothetical protein